MTQQQRGLRRNLFETRLGTLKYLRVLQIAANIRSLQIRYRSE